MRESYLYSDLEMYRVSTLSRVTGAITGGILGALTDFVVENPLNLIGNLIKEGIFKADTKTQLAENIFKFLYYSIGYILLWPFTPIKGLIDGAGYGIEYGFTKSWLTPALLEHDQTRGAFFKHFGRYEPTNILAPQHSDLKHNSADLDLKRKKLKSTEYKIKSAIYIGIAALAITAAFLVIFPPAGVIAATVGSIINAVTGALNGTAPVLIPAVPYLLAAATASAVAIIGKLASSIGVGISKAINRIRNHSSIEDVEDFYAGKGDYKENNLTHNKSKRKETNLKIVPPTPPVTQQATSQTHTRSDGYSALISQPSHNQGSGLLFEENDATKTGNPLFSPISEKKNTPYVTGQGKTVTVTFDNIKPATAGIEENNLRLHLQS